MANLVPGTKIVRITPSTTHRPIFPNQIGSIGGWLPFQHANPLNFNDVDLFPVEWVGPGGLWSSMSVDDEFVTWKLLYPELEEEDEELEPEEELELV